MHSSIHSIIVLIILLLWVGYCSADTEEEPPLTKLTWLKALEKYKEQKSAIDQNDEPVGDTQLRSEAKTKSIRAKQDKRKPLYLSAGQRHSVWTPKQPSLKKTSLTDVVMQVVQNKQDLRERQQRLRSRVMATQLVLKEQREEMVEDDGEKSEAEQNMTPEKRVKWQTAIKKVIDDNTKAKKKRSKRSIHFHDVVSRYAATMSTTTRDDSAIQSINLQAKADARMALHQWRSQYWGDPKQSRSRKPSIAKQSFSASNIPMQTYENS